MGPTAETVGATQDSEVDDDDGTERSSLTTGQRRGGGEAAASSAVRGADGDGEGRGDDPPASDDDEAPLTAAAPKQAAPEAKAPSRAFPPRWRLALAVAFLGLGLASYVAAHPLGSDANGSTPPRRPPKSKVVASSATLGASSPPAESHAVEGPAEAAPAPDGAPASPAAQAPPPAGAPSPPADAPSPPADAPSPPADPGADEPQGADEDEDDEQQLGKDGPSLLCFVWTLRRAREEELLPEVQKQLAFCEEHLIFTDQDAEGGFYPDIMQVSVPRQVKERPEKGWLGTRNFVGLLPGWTYMFENGVAEKHDWVVNLQFDDFIHPARARSVITTHMDILRSGNQLDKLSVHGPLMLRWGKTFVFNRKMVKAMKKRWPKLSRSGEAGTPESGCPLFMKGTAEWPQNCSQDLVYPVLADKVMRVPSFGAPLCGLTSSSTSGQAFPLTCWSMSRNPLGDCEEAQRDAIGAFASLQDVTSRAGAEERLRGTKLAPHWESFYLARQAPIITGLATPSVFALAGTMLGH